MMSFWETVKKDIEKGFNEGVYYVKEGATMVRKQAKKLTKEGQNRFTIYNLKSDVQIQMEELGGMIYDLSSKVKNPLLNRKVQTIIKRINRLEEKIAKLEKKSPKTRKMIGTRHKPKSKKKKTKNTS
jgi:hypothetical protein